MEKLKLYGCYGYVIHTLQRISWKFCRFKVIVYYLMAKNAQEAEVVSEAKRLSHQQTENEIKQSNAFDGCQKVIFSGLSKGNDLVAVYNNRGEIVSFGMINYRRIPFLNIDLTEQDAYMYYGHTLKQFRGNRFHSKLTNARLYYIAQNKKKRGLTIVRTYNRASVKAHKFEGFRRIQTFAVIRFWKYRICTLKYPD